MLMKRDEGEELRPPRWELEDSSLDGLSAALTEETITRARAIKLAGAALLAGTGLTMLFQSPADARKRRKRRRRKKKPVTTTPEQPRFDPAGETKSVSITNNQEGTSVFLLPDAGSNDFSISLPDVQGPLTSPLEIKPGETATVDITFAPNADVQPGSLTIVDADVNGQPLLGGDPLLEVPLLVRQ